MNKFAWLLIPLLVLGAVFTACGGGDDDNGTIRIGDEEIDIPDDADVESSGDSVPDGFPDDFPVYDGADVVSGFRGEQDGEEGFYVLWETDDDLDDVQAFYENAFDDGPWSGDGTVEAGGTVILSATHEEDELVGGVTLAEVDGKTQISAFVGDDTSSVVDPPDDGSSDDGSSDDDGSADSDDDSDGGSAELPDEVDIDDDYPSDDIPLPDAARVTSSSSFASGGSRSIFVEMYVETTVDEAADYYESTLEGAGYTESFRTESDGEVFMSFAKSDDPAVVSGDGVLVNVAPSEVDGHVLVSLTITSPDE